MLCKSGYQGSLLNGGDAWAVFKDDLNMGRGGHSNRSKGPEGLRRGGIFSNYKYFVIWSEGCVQGVYIISKHQIMFLECHVKDSDP